MRYFEARISQSSIPASKVGRDVGPKPSSSSMMTCPKCALNCGPRRPPGDLPNPRKSPPPWRSNPGDPGWTNRACCFGAGNPPRAAPAPRCRWSANSSGITTSFRASINSRCARNGSFQALERVEGGKHQVSACSALPRSWAGPRQYCRSRPTTRRSACSICARDAACSDQAGPSSPMTASLPACRCQATPCNKIVKTYPHAIAQESSNG